MVHPQRKKQYIDADVQGSLARRIIFHWLVYLMVAALVCFMLQVLTDPFQSMSSHLERMWWTHGPFLLVMVFLMPVFVVDSIKLSHRFAGPIFALRRAIREVAQGKQPRKLTFRRRDFWRELADDYNAMLQRVGLLDEAASSRDGEKQLVGTHK